MDRSIVELIKLNRAKRFIHVNFPIGITTIRGNTSCANNVAIRMFNYEVNSSVHSPFGQTTVSKDNRNIIRGRERAILIYSTYRLFSIRRVSTQVKSNFTRRHFNVQTRDLICFLFKYVNIGRNALSTRFFRHGTRRIRYASMSNEQTCRIITYLASVRGNVRINDLTKQNRRDARAAFRYYSFYNSNIVNKILRTYVRVSQVFRVRRAHRLFTNIVLRYNALVGERGTQFTFFQDPTYLCTWNLPTVLLVRICVIVGVACSFVSRRGWRWSIV